MVLANWSDQSDDCATQDIDVLCSDLYQDRANIIEEDY